PWVMSGRSAARLRYGLAMPPAHVSAVVVSAAADAEPVMKRRRVKGPLVTRMKRPPGIGLAPSSITSVQVAPGRVELTGGLRARACSKPSVPGLGAGTCGITTAGAQPRNTAHGDTSTTPREP